jgi:hypothetical protein
MPQNTAHFRVLHYLVLAQDANVPGNGGTKELCVLVRLRGARVLLLALLAAHLFFALFLLALGLLIN